MKYCPVCNKEYEDTANFCKDGHGKLEVKAVETGVTCPNCGAENPANSKFCNECGAKITAITYKCSKCGKEYDNAVKFCNECGGKVGLNDGASGNDSKETVLTILLKERYELCLNEYQAGRASMGNTALEAINDKIRNLGMNFLIDYENKHKDSELEDFLGDEQGGEEGYKWFIKAAENGRLLNFNNAGDAYSGGIGVSQNPTKAFEWYRKSAEYGSNYGRYCLALCYLAGDGVKEDSYKAFELFSELANDGYINAYYWLGMCYGAGKGVQVDPIKAFEMYEIGHKHNDVYCTEELGECYYYGFGCKKDKNYGIQLIRSAANAGVESAKEFLAENV